MKNDPRVDAYIERQAEFARPILRHIRASVHAACPSAEETLKWSAPAFMYRNEILGIMAAFKGHAAFNLWRGSQVVDASGTEQQAMGQFGRMTSLADAPDSATIAGVIAKAMALADAGVKPRRTKTGAHRPPPEAPDDLKAALSANPAAAAAFDAFAPSSKRDYVEWVTEAKQAATREKRIAQAVEWMAEGKKRHWKYEQC
jgi:uncharacterized protein YdeI (YjbR/CyaY-like superfamily)